MPRPLLGDIPMTGAERQKRYRAARMSDAPLIHIRRPTDRRSRIQRWNDTIAALTDLQGEYAAWLEATAGQSARRRHSRSLAGDCRPRPRRASNNRTPTRFRPRLNNEMTQTAWVTMTRRAACRQQPVTA